MVYISSRNRAHPTGASRVVLFLIGILLFPSAVTYLVFAIFSVENGDTLFYILLFAFLILIFIENYRYLVKSDAFGILSPIVLMSVFYFYISYGVGAFMFVFNPEWASLFLAGFYLKVYDKILAILFVLLSFLCVWRGYYVGMPIAAALRRRLVNFKGLRTNLRPAFIPVLILQLISIFFLVFAISKGIFGFSATPQARLANAQIAELVSIAIAAGGLAFFLLLVLYFNSNREGKNVNTLKIICIVIFIINIVIAAISGFKSQLCMPFVLIVFARFIVEKRISFVPIMLGVLALMVAYYVVEPYRSYLSRNPQINLSTPGQLVDALYNSYLQRDLAGVNEVPLIVSITARMDLLGVTAMGINFSDSALLDDDTREWMVEGIYLAPILAFAPRALWPDKPSYSTGVWFTQNVMGRKFDEGTSTAMGAVTYLYFTGGVIALVVGFLFIGVIQAIIFEGIARSGAGGLIIYLSVASILVLIPGDIGPSLTSLIRMLPIAFIAQFILLRPDNVYRAGVPAFKRANPR